MNIQYLQKKLDFIEAIQWNGSRSPESKQILKDWGISNMRFILDGSLSFAGTDERLRCPVGSWIIKVPGNFVVISQEALDSFFKVWTPIIDDDIFLGENVPNPKIASVTI